MRRIFYYSTTKDEKVWSFARNIGRPLNNKSSNGICSITPDGNTLLLLNQYFGERVEQGVSVSYNKLEGWTTPVPLEIEGFTNSSPFADYSLSVTQKELILAIEDEKGEGEQDLYVSFFNENENKWSKPLNLGNVVNSPLNEYSPFLAADGITLYFASEGHLGYGGADLFVTRRLDDTWTNWSDPENLGPVVNSTGDDSYYTIPASGTYAYFVSTSENKDKDIYRIPLPRQFKPAPVALLAGVVLLEENKPVEAQINVYKQHSKKPVAKASSNPLTGEYKLVLTAGSLYEMELIRGTDMVYRQKIDCRFLKEFKEVKRDILLSSEQAPDQEIQIGDETLETQSAPLSKIPVMMKGKVFTSTARPLSAQFVFEDLNAKEPDIKISSSPSNGDYKSVLSAGKIYRFSIFQNRQLLKVDTVDFSDAMSYVELNRNFIFGDSLISKPIILGNKYSSNLTEQQLLEVEKQRSKAYRHNKRFGKQNLNIPEDILTDLEHFAEFLTVSSGTKVTINSYSDNRGSKISELNASQERARICAEFFKAAGIDESRISYTGHGKTNYISSNLLKKGRARNLRIELNLIN